MKNDMTKYEAEQLLGLNGTYGAKDVTKAFRNKVKTCHPDVGGSEEEMVKINKAKEYLDGLFATDKNATYACDTAKTYTATEPTATKSEASWEADGSNGYASDGYAYPKWWTEADKAFYEENLAGADTTKTAAESAYPPPTGEPVNVNANDFVDTVVDEFVDKAANATATVFGIKDNFSTPEYATGNLPNWYKKADWLAKRFPWRIAFLFAALTYMFMFTFYGGTPMMAGLYVFAFFAAGINMITGVITNPIRRVIRKVADAKLLKWQSRHTC